MKLIDLISQTSWQQIAIDLIAAFPEEQTSIDGYQEVYDSLGQIIPAGTETFINIERAEDDFEAGSFYIHVYGTKLGDNMSYGLIYCSWSELLAMEIAPNTLSNFTSSEIVAYCLYEMTWAGFSEKEIDEERNSIIDADLSEDEL